MIDCEHQWNWDKETRFCLKCGQVRTFPTNGDNGKVVWQGLDDKRSPLELSGEEKSILAHLAQELGVQRVSDCIKIEMKLLRAWCGSYCRKPKDTQPSQDEQPVKRAYHRKPKPDQPTELSAEVEVAEPIEVLQKVPLSTEVNKSNLPPFPTFNDNWEAQVQSEWLVTYLELAKMMAMK